VSKNLKERTEEEIAWWKIAGRTAPFIAMAGMGICYLLAEHLIVFYIGLVVLIWIFVSVAWWWWAIEKILKVTRMMFDTSVKFEQVKEELRDIKKDVGNRKR